MVQSKQYQPDDTAVRPVSLLQRLWMYGGFALTAQFPPPLTAQTAEFVAQVASWAAHFDALLTADAPEGAIALSSLAMAVLLRRTGVETIVQMSGRDRNRLALQSDILSLSVLAIPDLLVDTRPITRAHLGQSPDARLVADLSGPALLSAALRLRDEARFSSGAPIKVPPVFYLGALVTPENPLPIEELHAAQFLVTAPVPATQSQIDRLASFCAAHSDFLQTRPLLVSLLLTTGDQEEDTTLSETGAEIHVQRTMAAIEALKTCDGVRGCNIVVERLTDLPLLERVARTLNDDGDYPHAYRSEAP